MVGWMSNKRGVNAIAVICLLLTTAVAVGQEVVEENKSPAAAKMREAYTLSQSAKTADDYSKIINLCQIGLDAKPSQTETEYGEQLMGWAYNKRGEARAEAGQEKEALQDFDAAVELDPAAWRAIHNRGVSRAILGRKDEAKADFDQVVRLNPKFATAWFNRGEWHYDRGEYRQAIENYDRAHALAADDVKTLLSRGHARYKLDEHTAALADFNRALELDANSAQAYIYRAAVMVDLGQYPAAAEDYRQAIRLDPEYGAAYQAAAWLMATCPDPRFRDAELAVQAAEKAVELDGEQDFHYLDTLAAAYASAGKYEQARQVQQKAIAAVDSRLTEVAALLKDRLTLYARNQPYREPGQQFAPAVPSTPPPRTGRRNRRDLP